MNAHFRTLANTAVPAITLGVLLLGGVWLADRAHRWERPAWRPASFVPLRGGGVDEAAQGGGAGQGGPVWVMAVNPRCPHCLAALDRVNAEWERCGRARALVSLIVDTSVRPGAAVLDRLPTQQVWWDRRGIWRRRWGHRLYGELMRFDGAGRFVGSAPAIIADGHDTPCNDPRP